MWHQTRSRGDLAHREHGLQLGILVWELWRTFIVGAHRKIPRRGDRPHPQSRLRYVKAVPDLQRGQSSGLYRCDCGGSRQMTNSYARTGSCLSCGCLLAENKGTGKNTKYKKGDAVKGTSWIVTQIENLRRGDSYNRQAVLYRVKCTKCGAQHEGSISKLSVPSRVACPHQTARERAIPEVGTQRGCRIRIDVPPRRARDLGRSDQHRNMILVRCIYTGKEVWLRDDSWKRCPYCQRCRRIIDCAQDQSEEIQKALLRASDKMRTQYYNWLSSSKQRPGAEQGKHKVDTAYFTYSVFELYQLSPCVYCGGLTKSIDQWSPGAGYDKSNAVPACDYCNLGKKDKDPLDFLLHLRRIRQRDFEPLPNHLPWAKIVNPAFAEANQITQVCEQTI